MNFGFRSSNAGPEAAYTHRPGSPSLDSGVLSGSVQQSSADFVDDASGDEWVLFSPQLGPIEEGLALESGADLRGDGGGPASARDEADLELPHHNGDGSFVDPQQPRSTDWMERINSWRLEQSHLLFSEFQAREPGTGAAEPGADAGSLRLWRTLTRRAAQSIGHYLVWDDHVLDALFSPDFVPRDGAAAPPPRAHLERAREYGPPGWEERARRHSRRRAGLPDEQNGSFMGLLARILLWGYKGAGAPEPMSARRHLEALQDSTVPSLSSARSAYWSDGWEYGTSTSVGTAA